MRVAQPQPDQFSFLRDRRIQAGLAILIGLILILVYINTAIKFPVFVKFLVNGM